MTIVPPTHPSGQRWTAAEITYVLEQYPARSARQIADDLNTPAPAVRRLLKRLKMCAQGAQSNTRASVRSKHPKMNDFDGAAGADRAQVATSMPLRPLEAASARNSPPAELLAVVRDGSVRQAADALRLSVGLIHQLRAGYWPDDPRRILRAWATYRGRTGRVESSWFLRRVRAGGVVPHAGRRWSGVGLQQHVGELVAVARMPDGALLAQTLELPAQRLPLEALP